MSTTSAINDTPEEARDNIPPEIPLSDVPIGRELGILFGFLATSLVIMAVYALIWRAIERREEDRDRLRRERLIARGVHHGRGGLHEKMLDQEVFMGRAELDVQNNTHSNNNQHTPSQKASQGQNQGENQGRGGLHGRTRSNPLGSHPLEQHKLGGFDLGTATGTVTGTQPGTGSQPGSRSGSLTRAQAQALGLQQGNMTRADKQGDGVGTGVGSGSGSGRVRGHSNLASISMSVS